MKTRPIRQMVQVETAMSPPFGALSLLPLDIVEKLIQKFDRIEEIGRLQAMHPVFERVIEKIFWHRVDSLIIKCTWLKVCPEGQHVWRLGKLDFTS
uniref:F-box domain-containing protein n=1 Tax=Plectus sambesii TaxID=2011161 RepID=A0A914VJ96_9BILA